MQNQINLNCVAKDFQIFAKVVEFRQIWSHCCQTNFWGSFCPESSPVKIYTLGWWFKLPEHASVTELPKSLSFNETCFATYSDPHLLLTTSMCLALRKQVNTAVCYYILHSSDELLQFSLSVQGNDKAGGLVVSMLSFKFGNLSSKLRKSYVFLPKLLYLLKIKENPMYWPCFFKKNGSIPASFCLLSFFSHNNFNNTNWK